MIKTVVVAVDGSEHGEKALAFAAEVARAHKARVIVIHALLRTTSTGDLREVAERFGFAGAVQAELRAAEAALVESAAIGAAVPIALVPDDVLKRMGELILEKGRSRIDGPPLEVETRLSNDDPSSAIVDCAKKEQADIVVIGSRGFGRVKGLIFGSVSQKVLQDVPCACLVVK